MRRLLFFIVITAMGMGQGLSQSLIQTYTDRCTGQVHVFSVPMNGTTVVAFYNKSKSFTYQDFQDGTLRAWLEETYLWWTMLSPCSSTATGATATQQVTQQTTQQATQAAASAAANTTTNVSPPTTSSPPQATQTSTPPPADTSTTNTTGSTQDTTASGAATGSTGDNTSGSGTTETGTTESQSGSTESNPSSSETSESTGSTEGSSESSSETKTEESSETKTEEKTEEVKEEKKEETKEESKEEKKDEEKSDESEEKDDKEESDEEKSDDEESEESEEEDSEEKKDDEESEEGDQKKKKKRNLTPPVVMANMLAQQMPTGEYARAAMFGISQTSLLGTETYGLNLMVFDNLQQFMLNGSYSKVHIKVPNVSKIVHDNHEHYSEDKEVDSNDPVTPPQPRVNRVYSASIGGMKMFTTYMGMMNHSMVWLGEKGSAAGLAFGTTITSLDMNIRGGNIYYDDLLVGTSLTGFWTKPFMYSPKLTIAPMVAVSSPFMSISLFGQDKVTWSKDIMIIGGPNITYKLTQRFGLNVGMTVVESTIKDFPTMKTFMIGGRLSF